MMDKVKKIYKLSFLLITISLFLNPFFQELIGQEKKKTQEKAKNWSCLKWWWS